VPRAVIVGHWATALGGILVISLALAVYVIDQYYSPRVYYLMWAIRDNVSPTIFAVCHTPHAPHITDGEVDKV
jgi:hypothetical protein